MVLVLLIYKVMGEIEMTLKSSIIILTLVTFSLVTFTVSQADARDGSNSTSNRSSTSASSSNCDKIQTNLLNFQQEQQDPKTTLQRQEQIKSLINQQQKLYDKCTQDKSDDKAYCTQLQSDFKDLVKDFPYPARKMAKDCITDDGESDDTSFSLTLMQSFVGQTPQGKKGCDIKGAKTSFKDDKKDLSKKIDDLQEKIRKGDEDILNAQKDSQKDLKQINDERDKLKEEWEKAQEDAQTAQESALAKYRDTQLQLSDQIRKLQTQEITARQNIQTASIELKAALTSAKTSSGGIVNLQSETSIKLACVAVAKKTNADNFGGSSSSSLSSGSDRVKALKDTYNSCVQQMHDLRNTISQSYINNSELRVKQHDDIVNQLSDAQTQLSNSVDDYNKALDKVKSKLTQAQQKYFLKDNELANEYNTALQSAQQNQSRLQMSKIQDQQTLQSQLTSQGKISVEEAQEVQSKSNALQAVFDSAKNKGCSFTDSIPDPSKEGNSSDDSESSDSSSSGGTR